jgi:upstream activation factor subunit UAF30
MRRFDKFTEAAAAPAVPKASEPTPAYNVKTETNGADKPTSKPPNGTSKKRSSPSDEASVSDAENDDESQLSSLEASPPPKKKQKASRSTEDSDAAFAARLQAEENMRTSRATRGAATGKRKAAPGKKAKKEKKKKSKARVGSDEDSDVEGGEKKEVKRNGGFHVSFFNFLALPGHELT